MSEARLAVVGRNESALGLSGGVQINGMGDVWRLAETLAKARGFVPDAYVDKPAALAAVILTGVELGLGPMTAMREIHVIKGRPTISATLMLTLARRAGIKTRWLKTDATIATIGVTVPGLPEQTLSFTAEQAKGAGLLGNDNWKKFPDAMLRARATSAAIRAFCPDVIGGSVYESESGEITDGKPAAEYVEATIATTPPKAAPAASTTSAPAPTTAKVPPQLPKITTREMFASWCEQWGASAAKDPKNAAHVETAAKRLGIDVAEALTAAGFAPPTPVVLDYDPETGEVPPDQEPKAP